MPRPSPGIDFLECLEELFQESSAKGFTSGAEFSSLKGKILHLLEAVSQTTAARARASCSIELPDGSQPDTYIQLPLSSFKVSSLVQKELLETNTGAKFVEVLRRAFEIQSLSRKTSGPKRKRNIATAVSVERAQASSPDTPKTKRVRIKFTKKGTDDRPSTPPLPVEPPVQPIQHFPSPPESDQERLSSHIIQVPAATEIPANPVPAKQEEQEGVTMTPSCFRPPQSKKAAVGADIPSSQTLTWEEMPAESSPAVQNSVDPDEGSDSSNDSSSENSNEEESEDDMDVDEDVPSTTKPALHRKRKASPGAEDEITPQKDFVRQKKIVNDLVNQIKDLTPEQLLSTQPKLLNDLLSLQEIQNRTPAPIPDSPAKKEARHKRLQESFVAMSTEIALIPAPNWATYEKKLLAFCDSDQVPSLRYGQRLWKILDIMWLPEEKQSVPNNEWERLDAVAKICTSLAGALGPEEEDAYSKEQAEKWLECKRSDLKFLKKILDHAKVAREIFSR